MKSNPYLRGLRVAVFDIETTGLSPSDDQIAMGGIYSFDHRVTYQYFAEDPGQEPAILRQTISTLNRFDAVITYNGDSFDWPFLYRRARKHGIDANQKMFQSVDLYRWLKLYWPQASRLSNLKQKSVECALGLSDTREDRINGAQSATLYRNYVQSKSPDDKMTMLLHNRDDLQQLARIADVLSFLPYHQIAAEQGFLIKGEVRNIHVEKVYFSGMKLTATAKTEPGLMPASIYGSNYQLEYDTRDGALSLIVLCEKAQDLIFADLTTIPVSTIEFQTESGFIRGRLVLKESGTIAYRSVCMLIRKTVEALMKEELNS